MKCYQIDFKSGYRVLVDANNDEEARRFAKDQVRGDDVLADDTDPRISKCVCLGEGYHEGDANALSRFSTADVARWYNLNPGETAALERHKADLEARRNLAEWMREAAHVKLDSFKDLKPNWNTYGGLPIDPDIIKAAHEFLDNMPADIYFSHIGPCSDGTVSFEWDEGNRALELEIETPTAIHYLTYDSTRKVELKGRNEARADLDRYEEDIYPLADFARSVELIRWVLAGTET